MSAEGLTGNAARAMEMATRGLYMLYGASYFTENEWTQIDCLLHKGKYVFTSGPTTLMDEELISFDCAIDPVAPSHGNEDLKTVVTEEPASAVVETERSLLSFSDESTKCPAESPITTSVEASSDNEQANQTSPSSVASASDKADTTPVAAPSDVPESAKPEISVSPAPNQSEKSFELQFADTTLNANAEESIPVSPTPEPTASVAEPTEIPTRKLSQLPPEGGLALGYSPELVAEMRALHNSYAKKHHREEPPSTAARSQNTSAYRNISANPMITEEEKDARIHSWASEVNSIEENASPRASPEPTPATSRVATPTLNHARPIVRSVARNWPRSSAEFQRVAQGVVQKEAEAFHKFHGRPPRSLGDLFQPNNDQFIPFSQRDPSQQPFSLRPKIRGSTNARGFLSSGSNSKSGSAYKPAILPNDKFKPNPHQLILAQQDMTQQNHRRQASLSTVSNNLDNFEGLGAAEWDEVPDAKSKSKTNRLPKFLAPQKPKAISKNAFALLAEENDTESEKTVSVDANVTNSMWQAGVREHVEGIVSKMLAETLNQGVARSTTPGRLGPQSSKDRIPPKTKTCWFWKATESGCRFKADECAHLHVETDPPSLALNNKDMPVWASLADYPLPPDPANADKKSCWYWATFGNCKYSAETCTFLHGFSPLGVAHRPPNPGSSWNKVEKLRNWRSEPDADADDTWGPSTRGFDNWGETGAEGEKGWGEAGVEGGGDGESGEAAKGGLKDSIWGAPGSGGWDARDDLPGPWTTDPNAYKPPHARKMEEILQTVEW